MASQLIRNGLIGLSGSRITIDHRAAANLVLDEWDNLRWRRAEFRHSHPRKMIAGAVILRYGQAGGQIQTVWHEGKINDP